MRKKALKQQTTRAKIYDVKGGIKPTSCCRLEPRKYLKHN